MATWLVNLNHSSALFQVRHMMVSWVCGQFGRITGSLEFDPLDCAAGKVEVKIEAASLYTGVEQRDQHLKSADFLDIENHPLITFKSRRVEPDGLDRGQVSGDLTVRGIPRPVIIAAQWTGPANFEDEGQIYTSFGFRGETMINREDFGMTYNAEMEHGGFMVGRQVHIVLNLEVDLVGAQKPF